MINVRFVIDDVDFENDISQALQDSGQQISAMDFITAKCQMALEDYRGAVKRALVAKVQELVENPDVKPQDITDVATIVDQKVEAAQPVDPAPADPAQSQVSEPAPSEPVVTP